MSTREKLVNRNKDQVTVGYLYLSTAAVLNTSRRGSEVLIVQIERKAQCRLHWMLPIACKKNTYKMAVVTVLLKCIGFLRLAFNIGKTLHGNGSFW
jgi:hypothetical protein